jgi:DNA-binding transcriptional LysR family regulator
MEKSMRWSDRIGRRVKLRDLHVLLTVAETRSMAKAAQRLAISQPVVSKTIADLERALGVRLLDRTSQGVEPTAYGNSFIHCGTAVFDEMRRGVQDIEFLADPTAGEVRIGTASPFVDLVTAAVSRVAARHPRIEWYVSEGDTPICCRMLRERKIDVGIGRLGSSVAGDLVSEPLYEDDMSVVAGPPNRWAHRRRIGLADLAGEAWVLPEANSVGWFWIDETFRSAGVTTPKPQVISNSMSVRMGLAETGRFLTMVSSSMLRFGAAGRRLKILPTRTKIQPVEILTLKNRTSNPIATLFIKELRTLAEPLAKGKSNRLHA